MPDDALREWVETWRRAGSELEQIRQRELQTIDTQEAIRQIFGDGDWNCVGEPRPTSGLIEQQAWFARLRAREHRP